MTMPLNPEDLQQDVDRREEIEHPPAAHILWQHLRGNPLGVRFRRQHAIDGFIVDFYAHDPRVIIDVDGSIHEPQNEDDAMRQAFLERLGYRVLRFTNEQVLQDMQGVLAAIRAVLEPHPLSPSPSLEQVPSSSTPSAQALPPSPHAGRGPGGGVYHAPLYGRRTDKYAWLDTHDLSTASYQPITPEPPSYFFTPRQTQHLQAYRSWPSVTEIFPVNSVGIVTARDALTIRWTPDEMWTTVLTFSQLSEELARTAFQLGKDARDWKVGLAQQDVTREGGPHRENIVPILYRPFDVRYTYYTGRSRGFHCMPRLEGMRHMLDGENLGLLVMRQVSLDEDYTHALITSHIVDNRVFASAKGIAVECPLYLSPSAESPEMFHRSRQPNLADRLLPKLSAAYGFTPSPEEVLAYIYAVLYSPAYRQTYAQELRTDFPRIPFTADDALFRQMAALGKQLMDLHLLRNPANTTGVRYQGQGSDRIDHVRYNPSNGRVSMNADKYVEGITPEMWEYRIGGYQVLEKYLKDRKGRHLADPIRYMHIAHAINRTIAMQTTIQHVYPRVEHHVIPI
jgi:very-short-patch-repair endonuclease